MRISQKQFGISLLVLFLVFAVSLITWWGIGEYKHNARIVKYRDPNIPAEQLKTYQDRIGSNLSIYSDFVYSTPDNERYNVLLALGNDYVLIGELAKAHEYYEEAAKYFPKDAPAWFALANTEVQMKDYEVALKHYNEAIKNNAKNVDYWKAKIDLLKGPLNASVEDIALEFTKARESADSKIDIITYYAQYLTSIGDKAGAIEQWKQAIHDNPSAKSTYEAELKALQ